MDLAGERGGDVNVASPLALAYDAFRTGLDHLVKLVDDGALGEFEKAGLVGFMQAFEQDRNRMALIDHGIIRAAQELDLPQVLCQGSMGRVLTSTLRVSKGEANRRVRAAAAVGARTSMVGSLLRRRGRIWRRRSGRGW